MNYPRLTLIDVQLVALSAALTSTAPLERDDYLQTMREALCALVTAWQGTDAELVAACQHAAERTRWREQHVQRRRADLGDDVRPAPTVGRTLKAAQKQRENDYGATGESAPYTLDLTDLAALTLADWQAVTRNLCDRNIISRDTARHILIEVTRLPLWAQPIARAILCSFSMAELRRAGYTRATVEAVRDMLQRLGVAYHLQLA